MARRLTPAQAVSIWLSTPGMELDRVVRFANALADHYVTEVPAKRIHISDLDLPRLAYGSLRRAGYNFVDEVQTLSYRQLQQIKHIGPHGALAIQHAIKRALNHQP